MSKQRVAILLLAVVAASALAFGARADVGPDDRVAVVVLPAPEGFSDGGDIPEGLIAVFVEPARDGFSDGGDIPEGFVAVVAPSSTTVSPTEATSWFWRGPPPTVSRTEATSPTG